MPGYDIRNEFKGRVSKSRTFTVYVIFSLPRSADCCVSSHRPPVPFKYKYLRIACLFIYASISLCDRVLFEMLMVLNIYFDHGYEDEHHLDVIYIYYSLE